MQEMIDIYDGNRQPTGETMAREGAFLREGQYMLYVLALIEDARGRFLITQRSLDKHWAAGWWEVTGGGVRAGETANRTGSPSTFSIVFHPVQAPEAVVVPLSFQPTP